jgi:hypothetical protein
MAENLDRIALPDRIRRAIGDVTGGHRAQVCLRVEGPCPEVLAEPEQLDAQLRDLLRRALERRRGVTPVTIEVTPRLREVDVAIDGERLTLAVALLSDSGSR